MAPRTGAVKGGGTLALVAAASVLAALMLIGVGVAVGFGVWGTSASAPRTAAPATPVVPGPGIGVPSPTRPLVPTRFPAPVPQPGAFLGVEVTSGAAPSGGSTPRATPSAPGQTGAGAHVVAVVPKSPAARAGIVAGDTITGVGGQPVRSAITLQFEIGHDSPGEHVTIAWVEKTGKQRSATVALMSPPRSGVAG